MRYFRQTDLPQAGSVHITGLERSGKTTIAAFLDAHPLIAVPNVGTNMWLYFAGRFGDLSEPGNLESCVDAMMSYDRIRWLEPDRSQIIGAFRSGPQSYGRLFSLFLSQFADRQSKPIWGTQSAWLDRYANQVFEAHPDTRVIHVVREPLDRYAAVKAHWPDGRGQAGAAAAKWNKAMRLVARNSKRYPTRYMALRFEDLVRHPEETLSDVCELIGVDYQRQMFDAVKRNMREVTDGVDKRPLVEVLSPASLGTFRGELTAREAAYVQTMTTRNRARLGYERVDIDEGAAGVFTRLAYWPDQVLRAGVWHAREILSVIDRDRFGPSIDPSYLVEQSGVPGHG